MARTLTYTAGASDKGRAVREIVRGELCLVAHDIARAKYRTEGGITVNGVPSLMNRILQCGDVVRVLLTDEAPEKTVPVQGPLSVLYEDEDIICLNKPAGLVVHPSHGHFSDTLANYLAFYYQERGESHEIRTIGRLDKDTSGVIAFGKSRTACAIVAGQVKKDFPVRGPDTAPDKDLRGSRAAPGAARKKYLALASGFFADPEGTVDAPISREYEEKIRRVVRSDGAPALTRYRVLEQCDGYALLAVEIETGRTHQIRVHMAHIGHPLLGDPIYGDGTDPERFVRRRDGEERGEVLQRAALHAWELVFAQPFTGETVRVTAPVPPDMRGYLTKVTHVSDQVLSSSASDSQYPK